MFLGEDVINNRKGVTPIQTRTTSMKNLKETCLGIDECRNSQAIPNILTRKEMERTRKWGLCRLPVLSRQLIRTGVILCPSPRGIRVSVRLSDSPVLHPC